jgi:hypothetical protein
MMTELQMSETLGLISEPEKNFVHIDETIASEIQALKKVFATVSHQKLAIGNANVNLWCEFVPWSSLN